MMQWMKFTRMMVLYGGLFLATFVLSSCSDEEILPEDEYINLSEIAQSEKDFNTALIHLKNAVKNYPNSANSRMQTGLYYLALDQGDAAEVAINKAISLGSEPKYAQSQLREAWFLSRKFQKILDDINDQPDKNEDPVALEMMGRIYLDTAQFQIAEEYITKALNLNPSAIRNILSQAKLRAVKKDFAGALKDIEKVLDTLPSNRHALFLKSQILEFQDQKTLTSETLKLLVDAHPELPRYALYYGKSLLSVGNVEAAKPVIQKAYIALPQSPFSNQLSAIIKMHDRDFKGSQIQAQNILSSGKGFENWEVVVSAMLIHGVSSYHLGEFEVALESLKKFHDRVPKEISGNKYLVRTYLNLGENDAAQAIIDTLPENTYIENDDSLLNLAAYTAAKVGNLELAAEKYQTLAERYPDNPVIQARIGTIELGQGETEKGFQTLEDILDETKDKSKGYIELYKTALRLKDYKRALEYAERYRESEPDKALSYLMSGQIYVVQKDIEDARPDFDKALSLEPEDGQTQKAVAVFEERFGDYDKALTLMQKVIAKDAKDIDANVFLVKYYIKNDQTNEAFTQIQKGLAQLDAKDPSRLLYAPYLLAMNQPQTVLDSISELPEEFRENLIYNITAGDAYLDINQPSQAISHLEKALSLMPTNIKVLNELARAYEITGDRDAYVRTLLKISELDSDDANTNIALTSHYLSINDLGNAQNYVTKIKPNSDQTELIKTALEGEIAFFQKDFATASTKLSKAAEKFTNNRKVMLLLKNALWANSDGEQSLSVLEDWYQRHPNDIQVLQDIATHSEALGKRDQAIAHYQTLLSRNNANILALNNLSMIYIDEKNHPEALKTAQKAYDLAQNNPIIQHTYGLALLRNGQAEKALPILRSSFLQLPQLDEVKLHLAESLIANNKQEEVKKMLDEIIANKDSQNFHEKAKDLLEKL